MGNRNLKERYEIKSSIRRILSYFFGYRRLRRRDYPGAYVSPRGHASSLPYCRPRSNSNPSSFAYPCPHSNTHAFTNPCTDTNGNAGSLANAESRCLRVMGH
jgi:hypothetical protein